MTSRPVPADVLLDCRWLSTGGPKRFTELLLRGLALDPPPGRWTLWGPEATADLAWSGAEVQPIATDPRTWNGQRSFFEIPPARLAVFLHQQRPLRNVPSLTVILDTIPLHFTPNLFARAAKRAFLRRVASMSLGIVTISNHARSTIERDLGVPADQIEMVHLPVDDEMVARVHQLRRSVPRSDVALYVGSLAVNKNVPRLLAGFELSEFCRGGGRLLLVGARPSEAAELRQRLTPAQRSWLTVGGICSQADLEGFFASCLFLVQPSLEEGFGLPAWEALSCGLPLCSSDGGALKEIAAGAEASFPATDVHMIGAAIDECARQARRLGPGDVVARSDAFRAKAPSVHDFAREFRLIVERCLAGAEAARSAKGR